jgi:hypothetical protein
MEMQGISWGWDDRCFRGEDLEGQAYFAKCQLISRSVGDFEINIFNSNSQQQSAIFGNENALKISISVHYRSCTPFRSAICGRKGGSTGALHLQSSQIRRPHIL